MKVGECPFNATPAAGILRRAAVCATAALAISALAAMAVLVGGLGANVRRSMDLPLAGWPRTPTAAAEIAIHNIQLVLAVIAAAGLVDRLDSRVRALLDGAWALLLAHNALLVGAALGAYGGRLALVVALHLPFELAAVSLAGGVYLWAHRAPISRRTLLLVAVPCCLLLVAGALLETYTPLGAAR